jgi:hypothetical protein
MTAFAGSLEPKILYANVASNTYTILDDTAVNVGGGYIVITGAEFQSGATVLIDTVAASAVSYINSTTLGAQVPARSAASYNLYVVNPDGGIGIKPAGITYSSDPIWVTTSPLANVVSNGTFSGSFSATGATSYANTTILPTGFNLLANGYYFGNISVGLTTTYSFDIKATDAELQDSIKTFSLISEVNPAPTMVEYLVVAGGGGGGAEMGGGGGAGGFRTGNVSITASAVNTITVGGGGAGVTSGNASSLSGTGFTTVTSAGGGRGASFIVWNGGEVGVAGGSGGGGGGNYGNGWSGGAGNTPATTPSQGNNGGSGYPFSNGSYKSGAGGGAGAVGGNAGASSAGDGGTGREWPIDSGTYYAGGGGGGALQESQPTTGGAGGLGGGGRGIRNGGTSLTAVNGTINTGGGGGAGSASGGSGVVIIRYSTSFSIATSTTGSPEYTVSGGFRTYKFINSGSITW